MDEIKGSLDRLSDLSDGEIADLEGRILSTFDDVEKQPPTHATVDTMTGLADALEAVRGETARRFAEQEELTRRATEAATRVRATPADTAAVNPEEEKEETPEEAALTPEEQAAKDEEERRKAAAAQPAAAAVEGTELSAEAAVEPAAPAAVVEEPAPAVAEAAVATEELATEEKQEEVLSVAAETSSDVPSDENPTTPDSEGAVSASATNTGQVVVTPPAGNRPVPREEHVGVGLAITAGADIPGIGSGQTLKNMDDVATAFAKRLHTLRNVQGGSGEQHTIATMEFSYPEDRKLSGDDPSNMALIDKVTSVEAITAAAAICAPLETLYDINICGVNDRPIRDSLARFNADRGGVRIYAAPVLGNCGGIWTTTGSYSATTGALSIAVSPTSKVCCDAVCADPADVILDAIYACMRFSNFTSRFFPEIIKANTDLALINQARVAEQYLLNGIAKQSVAVTAPSNTSAAQAGVTREVIRTIRQAAVGIRRRNRLGVNAPMRVILPNWLLDAMVADIALQMPGDGLESLSISEAKLRALFSDANVNVTWSLESADATGAPVVVGAQTAGPLQEFPDIVSFPVFPEGSFLWLDGGTLDLGVVRDTTTIAANEYATFVESFESVVRTGCESLWVTLDGVCISGAAAALVDTSCAAGA